MLMQFCYIIFICSTLTSLSYIKISAYLTFSDSLQLINIKVNAWHYKMEEGKYNRDINCLRDRDKSTRISALQRLLSSLPHEESLPHLFSRLKLIIIELLQDPTDKCKELSLKLLEFFTTSTSIPPEDLPHILQGLHSRIGTDPSPETCEEVRIASISLVFLLCRHYSAFIHIELQRITDIIARGCKDKCPAIKTISGEMIVYLSEACKKIGYYSKKILENCTPNLYHQQYKVRINCLQAIGALARCEGTHQLIPALYGDFKKVQIDRRPEVCETMVEVIYYMLKVLPGNYLREVEGKFCYLLLSSEKDKERFRENIEEVSEIHAGEEEERREHAGALHVIMKNLKEIVWLCIKDLQEWTIQDNYRSRAGAALLHTIEICRHLMLTYVENLLPVLFRSYSFEPAEYLCTIIQKLGEYCDLPILISLFSSYSAALNSSQDVASSITLLQAMLAALSASTIAVCLPALLALLTSLVTSDDALVLRASHGAISLLLDKFQSSLPMEPIFQILLVLDTSIISPEVQSTITSLANYGGITIQELYLQNLEILLPKLIRNYRYWDGNSPEPAKFARLVCRAEVCTAEIIEVACFTCKKEGESRVKVLMLEVVECCFRDSMYSQIVIEDAIIPTASWRPQGHVLRVKSILLFNRLMADRTIDGNVIKLTWEKIFPLIRTCCNDENSELRQLGVNSIEVLLRYFSEIMEEREILDIYPELLKRLDDSVDSIRIAACLPFCIYFTLITARFERRSKFGNFKYVVESLFTHLDDPSDKIQRAVGEVLQASARFNKEDFLKVAMEAKQKHKHPRSVGELIEMANRL